MDVAISRNFCKNPGDSPDVRSKSRPNDGTRPAAGRAATRHFVHLDLAARIVIETDYDDEDLRVAAGCLASSKDSTALDALVRFG
jgi:hypothetical protein